jgi:hypothetical protein
MTKRFISLPEYRAHHSRFQWSTGVLSKLPACNADHQLYHLTMSRMNGATSPLRHVPSWAPKGQTFITLSFLHNFVTGTYVAKITYLFLGAMVESESAFVCEVWNGGGAYRSKLDAA